MAQRDRELVSYRRLAQVRELARLSLAGARRYYLEWGIAPQLASGQRSDRAIHKNVGRACKTSSLREINLATATARIFRTAGTIFARIGRTATRISRTAMTTGIMAAGTETTAAAIGGTTCGVTTPL